MKNTINLKNSMRLFIVCLCASAFAHFAAAQIATGGDYTLTQTAIANGGASGAGASASENYSLAGTIGQAAAGTKQTNASYTFSPGFWTAQPIYATTAADVTVGGRVTTADGGRGIRNVRIILTNASGETRYAISGASGYFRFTDVQAGETYIFSAIAKRYRFSQSAQVRTILEDADDINFIAVSVKLID